MKDGTIQSEQKGRDRDNDPKIDPEPSADATQPGSVTAAASSSGEANFRTQHTHRRILKQLSEDVINTQLASSVAIFN